MPTDADDLDLESRRLCPDGACIGVIRADGRCSVCGRADDGSIIKPVTREMATLEAADADGVGFDEEHDAAPEEGDDDRELCPDGSCIGLIGSDGKCKVCGRARGS